MANLQTITSEADRNDLDRRLAEQEILRQSLEEKDERIANLESHVTYLRTLLRARTGASYAETPATLSGGMKRTRRVREEHLC